MESLYVFLIRNDVWIYILAGLGLFWYLSQLWQARRALRSAMFGLERERGQARQRTALTFIVTLAAIIGGVVYVNREIAPTLPPELLRPPTPTPDIFATVLSSPIPPGGIGAATATLNLAPTVTLPGQGPPPAIGTPVATAAPTPDVTIGGCNPAIAITAPPNGVTVSGPVTFFGTASADGFTAFDLEVNGPNTGGEWISVLERPGTQPIFDNILGATDVSPWPPGDYVFRLVVTATGETAGECAILLAVADN